MVTTKLQVANIFVFFEIRKDIYSTIEESSKQIRDEINSRFAVTSRAHQQNCIELKNAFQGMSNKAFILT